ncbi:MAG: MotA/TolQ/ExbB proton channel family protein [Lachnospiraceae bacterium]|nr:MotA/TolQ/ExbB proton channel family protein [Lachnospiraceae bacterium]
MPGRKWYEWLLTIVYVLMALVCIYLNFFMGEQPELVNLIVNGTMFVIVGLIFLKCESSALIPANRVILYLRVAMTRIKEDAENAGNAGRYLWETYRNAYGRLFDDGILADAYRDFLTDAARAEKNLSGAAVCEIEDYIGDDLADELLHRNVINQVPGALTGLGILGTFIGLSFGLQGFATGSTAEITNSIAPLMSGIKVAFHTSIYGMVFSLIFNYVYKRKIEETEEALHEFAEVYHRYVLPDAETDTRNRMMDMMKTQTEQLRLLTHNIADSLAEGLEDLLTPQFDRFDDTIARFAEGAEKNQLDALGVITNAFIAEMNKSLNNSFSQLSYTIDQTYKLQKENAAQLRVVLSGTAEQAARYTTWLGDQERLISTMHDDIDRMPQITDQTAAKLSESVHQANIEFREMVVRLEKMAEKIPDSYSEAYVDVQDALGKLEKNIERLNDSLVETIRHFETSGKEGKEKVSIFGKRGS